MFICQVSGKVSKPGEKPFKIVTKTRNKQYTNEIMRGERKHTITSEGWEIVEEKTVCAQVYDSMLMNESREK